MVDGPRPATRSQSSGLPRSSGRSVHQPLTINPFEDLVELLLTVLGRLIERLLGGLAAEDGVVDRAGDLARQEALGRLDGPLVARLLEDLDELGQVPVLRRGLEPGVILEAREVALCLAEDLGAL